jgi:hypothetical protein
MQLERVRDSVMNETVQLRGVAPTHFRLLGMHIDIDSVRVDLDEQHEGGLEVWCRATAVRLANRVLKGTIGDRSTVDEDALGSTDRSKQFGAAGKSHDPRADSIELPCPSNRQRVGPKDIGEHGERSGKEVGHRLEGKHLAP